MGSRGRNTRSSRLSSASRELKASLGSTKLQRLKVTVCMLLQMSVPSKQLERAVGTLSKWLKEALNSFICSWVMPFASLVRIWVSTSLMVLAMVVRSNSHPTRICYQGEEPTTVS